MITENKNVLVIETNFNTSGSEQPPFKELKNGVGDKKLLEAKE